MYIQYVLGIALIFAVLDGNSNHHQLNQWPSERTCLKDILQFKQSTGKKIVTLFGYASSGYENIESVMDAIKTILDERFPCTDWIVNAPGSAIGIGNFYAKAQQKHYETMGIISSHVLEVKDQHNPDSLRYPGYPIECKNLFMIQDIVWGGYLSHGTELSPTTAAMIGVSDAIIQAGGNEIAKYELIAALNTVTIQVVIFIPAKMNSLCDDTTTQGFGEASLEVKRIQMQGGHPKLEINLRFSKDLGGLPEIAI